MSEKAESPQTWVSFTKRTDEVEGNDATAIARLHEVFAAQRVAFFNDPYPTIATRIARLEALSDAIVANRDEILAAVARDFITDPSHPDPFTDLFEIFGPAGRAAFAIEQLSHWMAPMQRQGNDVFYGDAKCYMLPQPKGVILNMAPWNLPYDVGIGPIIEMLAAGNRAVLKPSDLSVHSGPVMAKIMEDAFPNPVEGVRPVEVICGGLELSKACVQLPWDHLVYTGGGEGARAVMRACAENLVPVTLELGGKCPVILDGEPIATDQRIVDELIGMKLCKNGQVCVSVDYVLIPQASKQRFVELAKSSLARMAPEGPANDRNISGVINNGHAARIASVVKDARARGAEVIQVGEPGNEARKPPFHFIINAPQESLAAREESFGPVLGVRTYQDIDEAINYVKQQERPLGISLFTNDEKLQRRVMTSTISGGFNVNAGPWWHSMPSMGFGGSGESGMGRHHGYEGFLEFTNMKAVFERGEGGVAIGTDGVVLPPFDRQSTKDFLNDLANPEDAG